jgi:hypothetical protein
MRGKEIILWKSSHYPLATRSRGERVGVRGADKNHCLIYETKYRTEQEEREMIEHKHMKFMAITTIAIIVGFGLYLLVTAYLYA